MSDDLFPRMTRQYKPNSTSGNSILLGEFSGACFPVIPANLENITPRQLVPWPVFSSSVWKCLLLGIVLGILLFGSKPQVGWIDTGCVIPTGTIMANAHPFGNVAVVNYPRSDVSPNHLGINTTKSKTSSGKLTVSILRFSGRPKPTGISFYDLGPESTLDSSREPIMSKDRIWVRCDSVGFPFLGIDSNLVLHNQLVWLCHAPGHANGAGAPQLISDS